MDEFNNVRDGWKSFIAKITRLQSEDILILNVQAASSRVTTEAQTETREKAEKVKSLLLEACKNPALQPRIGACELPFAPIKERYVAAPSPPAPPSSPAPPGVPNVDPAALSSGSSTAVIAVCIILGVLLLFTGVYFCWRRNLFVRCGLPYKPLDESLVICKSALNLRFYTVRGATPTRLDAECNFNTPAKGSFGISRLGIVRDALPREQRRRIPASVNQDINAVRHNMGLRALEISKSAIEPMAGTCGKHAPRRGLARSESMPRRRKSFGLGGTDASSTELNSESTRSESPEFGRKNAMSIEEKAASEVRQQAIAYSQRARMRAREDRKSTRTRCRAASEPAHAADLERKPSFMKAQRQLLQDLQKIDSSVDIDTILGDTEATCKLPERSPKQLAHDWLSRAMASTVVGEEGEHAQQRGDPKKALARARGHSATATLGSAPADTGAGSDDRNKKLARARAARQTPDVAERGRSLSFTRSASRILTRSPSLRRSPSLKRLSANADRTRTMVSEMRSSSFSRSMSFRRKLSLTGRKSTVDKTAAAEKHPPTQAELLRAAAASYAQNHRLNSRVPGSDGLDPTTSALFEARTLNVPLPPPLISTGEEDDEKEKLAAEGGEGKTSEAAGPSTPTCSSSKKDDEQQRVSSAHKRVGRAKKDSVSRAKAAGAKEDPTKITARRKFDSMAAEAVELARHRSFSRSRASMVGGEGLKPDGRGSWVADTALTPEQHIVDIERLSTADSTLDMPGAGTRTAAKSPGSPRSKSPRSPRSKSPPRSPRPIRWRAVGGADTSTLSGVVKGPSPRQNKVLQI